jgi:hypothetical protein
VRGQNATVGDTRVSANGYHYTRTEEGWRLTHQLVAEKKLGRPLAADERVRFKDKKRDNLKPENIEVVIKGTTSLRRRKAVIENRIEELQAELAEINKEIQAGKLR